MRYLDVHVTIRVAQTLYEAFEDWITAQISTSGIFSHQELFDWMVLDFAQKCKKLIKEQFNFNSKCCEQSVIVSNEKEMHLNCISENFEINCDFQSIRELVKYLSSLKIFSKDDH